METVPLILILKYQDGWLLSGTMTFRALSQIKFSLSSRCVLPVREQKLQDILKSQDLFYLALHVSPSYDFSKLNN